MLSEIRKRRAQGDKGFTLIEVMIVLAIAGLILLVVFLAVPALQRNARNTQRREDAGNILSAISEYMAGNNSMLPANQAAAAASSANFVIGASGTNQVTVPLGYYDATDISIVTYAAGNTNTTTEDTIVVMKEAACSSTSTGNPEAGSSRSVVILYTVENDARQCRAS